MNKKKIVAIVAAITLVAILAVCLVACNADSYTKKLEKAEYKVVKVEQEDLKEMGIDESKIDWAVSGNKGLNSVSVIKFKKTADAKEFESDFAKLGVSTFGVKCERSSGIVFVGTEEAIKVVK